MNRASARGTFEGLNDRGEGSGGRDPEERGCGGRRVTGCAPDWNVYCSQWCRRCDFEREPVLEDALGSDSLSRRDTLPWL